MASIVPGSIVADIRGRVGDEVYSRNQGGIYVRSAGTWVQPDTQRQLDTRAVITALSQAWSGTLTDQQRKDWRSYGQQWPRPNKFGSPTITNGYLAFIRVNAQHYRQYTAIGFPDPPPAGPIHPPAFTFAAAANETGLVALPPTNYATPPADLRLYLYGGNQVNPGVQYFSSPWRYIGVNTHCADCMSVTGTLNPDATGVYHRAGNWQGYPLYTRQPAGFSIFREPSWEIWCIDTVPNENPTDFWSGNGTIEGTYFEEGIYTGDAEVADVGWTTDPWTLAWPFDLDAAKKVFAYMIAQLADTGEISTPYRAQTIVTA